MLYLLFFLSIFLNHSAPIAIFIIHPILILFFLFILLLFGIVLGHGAGERLKQTAIATVMLGILASYQG